MARGVEEQGEATRPTRARAAVAAAAVMATLSSSGAARAQHATGTGATVVEVSPSAPPSRELPPVLRWRWRTFDAVDYGITGTAFAVAVGSAVIPVPAWRWSGALDLEDAARSLRMPTYEGRRAASDVSDVLLAATVTAPVLFDALVTAWGRRRSGEVARELVLIDIETYAIVGAVTALTSSLVARERPYGANGDCGSVLDPEHFDCDASFRVRYRSFFSGHSSLSFTGAALVCTHHARLELYGGAGDAAACVAAMSAAASTATLRVVADRHYLGDVVAGAATGTLLGLGLPWLLHYRSPRPLEGGGPPGTRVMVVPSANGAAVVGTF